MESWSRKVKEAVAVLKKGGVVVFPTETAYGLAADPENRRAVKRIYHIKGREAGKKLPLIAADAGMAIVYAKVSPLLAKLARKHWPGPLTVVGKRAAVRVSSHPVARALSRGLGRPIISTSANVSGQPTCYSVKSFLKQLSLRGVRSNDRTTKQSPDFIIDVGALPRRKPSTIVTERKGQITILRQGSIRL